MCFLGLGGVRFLREDVPWTYVGTCGATGGDGFLGL